jgi:hypothetical protein
MGFWMRASLSSLAAGPVLLSAVGAMASIALGGRSPKQGVVAGLPTAIRKENSTIMRGARKPPRKQTFICCCQMLSS